ncbi:hypothetical protein QJS10_CPB19g00952 [Acorus calamus]|uniref:Uncharacterized protein n=1 Tax=Acorus calamus TaxID=4465 RepID=A0AAV9CJQ9_ACOCL|nr:hypothetical protein QJS10_CPB19g00952 [Acorus calamus]
MARTPSSQLVEIDPGVEVVLHPRVDVHSQRHQSYGRRPPVEPPEPGPLIEVEVEL